MNRRELFAASIAVAVAPKVLAEPLEDQPDWAMVYKNGLPCCVLCDCKNKRLVYNLGSQHEILVRAVLKVNRPEGHCPWVEFEGKLL